MLSLEVIFKKATRKADDSVTLSFETQLEVSTEQMTEIDSYRKKTGFLVFKQDAIKASEIPKGDTSQGNQSPSQELRASLYALWVKKTELKLITEDWDTYYSNAMAGFKRSVDRSHPDKE
jgi:hypothetical protein